MDHINHLQNKEAIEKMKTIVDHNSICMFCTDVDQIPFPTRPMATQEVDDEGNFWFFSSKESHKNQEVNQDHKVQLIFANTSNSEYLSVSGRATIFYDRKKVEELWSPLVKTWFNEGKDDPNLTLIRVSPEEGYYWDTKDGKIVSMLKIAVGAAIGKELDGSIEGKIEL